MLSALAPADVGGGISSADSADDAALPLLDPKSRAVEGLRAMMSNPEKYAAPPVTLTVADAVQIYWLFTRKHRGIGQPLCPELAKHGQPGFYTALASLSAGKFVHVDARECRSLLGVLTSKTGSPRSATGLLPLAMWRGGSSCLRWRSWQRPTESTACPAPGRATSSSLGSCADDPRGPMLGWQPYLSHHRPVASPPVR